MYIAVDFDNTIVAQDHDYADLDAPLRFMPNAKAALLWLKRAGHVLLLWSGRASRSLLEDPQNDPLVRAGVRKVNVEEWERMRPVHQARYEQMVEFVNRELPGVFDAIDDGLGGKPQVNIIIDDKALRLSRGLHGIGWREIAFMYGDRASIKREAV